MRYVLRDCFLLVCAMTRLNKATEHVEAIKDQRLASNNKENFHMKNLRLLLLVVGIALTPGAFTIDAKADPVLLFPNANQLTGPVFIQPSVGLAVVALSNGVGTTNFAFVDLPDNSFNGNFVVNILGNFQAFDPDGNPVTNFQIVGVEVMLGNTIFTPSFGQFDFVDHPSLTFVDSLDFDTITFSDQNLTFSFAFAADPSLIYSYRLLITGLPEGSFVLFDDPETGSIPEPATLLLLGSGFVGLGLARRKIKSVTKKYTT